MSNLTITVDAAVLRRARIRAIQEGTSVNAVLRAYLEAWSRAGGADDTGAALAELARASVAGSGPEGRRWTRDDLHDR